MHLKFKNLFVRFTKKADGKRKNHKVSFLWYFKDIRKELQNFATLFFILQIKTRQFLCCRAFY